MFEFRPELVNDDDEEADDTRYIQGAGGDEVRPSFDLSCWSYWREVVEKNRSMAKGTNARLWSSGPVSIHKKRSLDLLHS